MKTRIAATALGVLLLATLPAWACLWDDDTLRDERRGLPGMAELLAGKYEQHSKFYYEQRAEKMRAAMKANPNDENAIDNLAVALEKLGYADEAITLLLEKEKRIPRKYTTYANLGTIYLNKGDYPNAFEYINKAFEINPGAHFNRAEYQLKLAIFLSDAEKDPEVWQKRNFLGIESDWMQANTETGFQELLRKCNLRANTLEGVAGLLRFSSGPSAEVYYVLGKLLKMRGHLHLAYRAFQRAIDLNHPAAGKIVNEMQPGFVHDKREFDPVLIASERAEAAVWVKAFQDYEDNLLREGKDVTNEANFDAFYKRYGKSVEEPTALQRLAVAARSGWMGPLAIWSGVGFAAVAGVVLLLVWRRRRRVAIYESWSSTEPVA